MLTHFNMSSNVMQFLQPGGTNHQIATTNYQDTYICLLPFFHTYGVTLLMNTGFETGAKLVTLPQFEVQSYLKAIDDHKVNISRYLTALYSYDSNPSCIMYYNIADSDARCSSTSNSFGPASGSKSRVAQSDAHNLLWGCSYERANICQTNRATKQSKSKSPRRYS